MLPESTMAVDLTQVEDWEKLHILQVLRRNERIKQREDRRIQQLAVRVQLERMNDKRSPRLESQIKTITGHWHREIALKRCQQADLTGTLYRRISSDLTSVSSRKTSGSSASSPSSKVNEELYDHRTAAAGTNFSPEKLVAVRQWVNNQNLYHSGESGQGDSDKCSEISYDGVNNNEKKH